jgi:glycosyltransferase involved in cell wall biosynthesis
LPPDRVAVVFNGIDLDEVDRRVGAGRNRAESLCPGAGLRRVCVVGSIRQSKDHVLALQTAAVALTRDPRLRFIFVGAARVDAGSAYEQRVMAEHRRLGLESQVLFVGHRNDVYEIIASSDALLVTSAREGFPNVVLEAMACGTPVASTDYSDVRRILPLAWQVDAERDPATLAAILARCISERPVVAAAQRQWVERHASIGASARAMLDAYRALGVAQARLETA